MGRADFWKRGQWKAICDVCGQAYHSNQLTERWDGLMCCPQDWNPRQPQDFVRGVIDRQYVPWSRPDVQPPFVSTVSAILLDTNGCPILDLFGTPVLATS